MDLGDDPQTATALFSLTNMIVDVMIAQPKRVAKIYSTLPARAIEGIKARDQRQR